MSPVVENLPRWQRKQLLDAEARRRRSGEWGVWEEIPVTKCPLPPQGWCAEIRHVYRNKVFAVLVRPVANGLHLAISSLSGIRPTWHEMQRIKNYVLGDEATAVEVYPPASEVVDGADMFHIWSVPPLPFSLWRDSDALAENAEPEA